MTGLLRAWSGGDVEARDEVVRMVYGELRRRAAAQLRRERGCVTLVPTGLVHEAFLRLDAQHQAWQNRAQFFALAAARAWLYRRLGGRVRSASPMPRE